MLLATMPDDAGLELLGLATELQLVQPEEAGTEELRGTTLDAANMELVVASELPGATELLFAVAVGVPRHEARRCKQVLSRQKNCVS